MEILSCSRLAEKIREVCQTPGPRKCAVAFWGHPIGTSLFGSNIDDVEVIVDVSMGGTTFHALSWLRDTLPGRAWVLDGLHAKLYISPKGGVIGSANASRNALGSVNPAVQPRLLEVGVWIDARQDTVAYEQALTEFERLKSLKDTHLIRDEDVRRASVVPRNPAVPTTNIPVESLFSIVRSNPHHFEDVLFSLGGDDYMGKEEEESANAYLREHSKGKKGAPQHQSSERASNSSADSIILYLNDSFSDKTIRSQFRRKFRAVVMFWWENAPGLYTYTDLNIQEVTSEGSAYYALVGHHHWTSFKGFLKGKTQGTTPLPLLSTIKEVKDADHTIARELADRVSPKGSGHTCWLTANEICRLAEGETINAVDLEMADLGARLPE